MTEFNLNPKYFDMWLHQNNGVYTGDFVDGCLLDNFIVATKRGYAAFYEKACTTWTSCYHVYFEPYPAEHLFEQWYEFEKEAEKQDAEAEKRYKNSLI